MSQPCPVGSNPTCTAKAARVLKSGMIVPDLRLFVYLFWGRGMADKLDKAIADKRSQVDTLIAAQAALTRDLEIAQAELAAFLAAASLRPGGDSVKRKGRQPGAISSEWKSVLSIAYLLGPQSYQELLNLAIMSNIQTDIGNVRERVRNFIRAEFMAGSPEAGFYVTEKAAERFGFQPAQQSAVITPPYSV